MAGSAPGGAPAVVKAGAKARRLKCGEADRAARNKARISSGGVGGGATRVGGEKMSTDSTVSREEPPIRSLGKGLLVAPIPSRSVSCTKKSNFFLILGKEARGRQRPILVSVRNAVRCEAHPPPPPQACLRAALTQLKGGRRYALTGLRGLLLAGFLVLYQSLRPRLQVTCRMAALADRAATLLVIALRLLQ